MRAIDRASSSSPAACATWTWYAAIEPMCSMVAASSSLVDTARRAVRASGTLPSAKSIHATTPSRGASDQIPSAANASFERSARRRAPRRRPIAARASARLWVRGASISGIPLVSTRSSPSCARSAACRTIPNISRLTLSLLSVTAAWRSKPLARASWSPSRK